MTTLSTVPVAPDWINPVQNALRSVPSDYIQRIEQSSTWLPGHENIFNAFSLPLGKTRYILFGESPYPRQLSANGFAFWDAAVDHIWSTSGLATTVNRATSLRNLIKMLLVADDKLSPENTSQSAIACLDKSKYVDTLAELFANFHQQGFLLLNASLVLSENSVRTDAKVWHHFMQTLLTELAASHPDIQLLLFGKIAEQINKIPAAEQFHQLACEHPYNLSFITNPDVLNFFKPFHLLHKSES